MQEKEQGVIKEIQILSEVRSVVHDNPAHGLHQITKIWK